jgi:FtsH-binding integral membrane protein
MLFIVSQSSIWQTFKSVAAAFFGVQTENNRKRDFSQGKLSHFIITGVIAVIIFVACLIAVVSLVVPN